VRGYAGHPGENHQSKVEIAYKRGVTPEGNLQAQKIMAQVFEPCPANWRGMGKVPDSGLKLRHKFADYDAEVAFDIKPEPAIEPKGCICGEILRGVKTPADCRLFRKICTPENPVGRAWCRRKAAAPLITSTANAEKNILLVKIRF